MPISNPKSDLYNINAHTKFGENPLCLLKLSSGNENMGVSQADNSVKFDEISPIAIPNQISTISMHTKFGENPLIFTQAGNEKRMDGRMYD